jgi:hypothetical protein
VCVSHLKHIPLHLTISFLTNYLVVQIGELMTQQDFGLPSFEYDSLVILTTVAIVDWDAVLPSDSLTYFYFVVSAHIVFSPRIHQSRTFTVIDYGSIEPIIRGTH